MADPAATFTRPSHVAIFALAGNAILTVKSRRTGDHRTYRVRRPKPDAPFFLSLLTGPDNETSYTYVGVVDPESLLVRPTKKSTFRCDSVPVRAWNYVMSNVGTGQFPDDAEIMHEGRCGACGRTLTVPESIERGIGPECFAKMGGG